MLAMLLFITAGAFFQSQSFNSGILITEFVIIALPAFIFVIMKKGSIKKELRFNKLYMLDALLVTMIFCLGYPIAIFFNLIGSIVLSLFGKLIQSPIPIAESLNEYFILMLIIAGSAGLCEEVLFRGLIMRAYEKVGKWKSIVFTALLFALLHLNVQNILGPLFLGILLGYVVHTTNSIFAGMLGHFVNNGISVTLSFLIMQLPFAQGNVQQDISQAMMLQSLILVLFIFAFFSMVTGPILYFCMKALKELASERKQSSEENVQTIEIQSLRTVLKSIKISWPLYISFLVVIVFSVLQLAYIILGNPLIDVI